MRPECTKICVDINPVTKCYNEVPQIPFRGSLKDSPVCLNILLIPAKKGGKVVSMGLQHSRSTQQLEQK